MPYSTSKFDYLFFIHPVHPLIHLQTMCNFLSSFRMGFSPSFFNKKSVEFGHLYNVVMLKQIMLIFSDQSSSADISTQLEAAEQCTYESDTSAVPKNSLSEHGEYIETYVFEIQFDNLIYFVKILS